MRIVECGGLLYAIPDWVNWVAQDRDGRAYGYENEPSLRVRDWMDPGEEGRIVELERVPAPAWWLSKVAV